MKKIKVLTVYVGLIIIMCSLFGCKKSNKNENSRNNSIEDRSKTSLKMKDDIVVLLDNYDIAIYNEGGTNNFCFKVITKEELDSNELRVTFDNEVEYKVYCSGENFNGSISEENSNKNVYMTDRTAMTRNGIDWKKCYELNDNEDKLKEYTSKFTKGKGDIIDCYFYNVTVIFNQENIKENSTFNKIFVEYKGNKIEKDIRLNLINYNRNTTDAYTNTTESVVVEGYVEPNNTGDIVTYDVEFTADRDFKVKGVKTLYDNGIEIANVDVISSANNNIQQKYEGEIDLKKGDVVKFIIQLKDKDFANKLTYRKTAVVAIDYEDNGVEGQHVDWIQLDIGALLDELFVSYVEGVDVMPYYNDYHNKINK